MRTQQTYRCQVGNTIPQVLRAQADHFGNQAAVLSPEGSVITYDELAKTVFALSAQLRQVGVNSDSRVAVVLPNGLDIAIGMLACCSAAIALPFGTQHRKKEYQNYFEVSRVTHLLTSKTADSLASQVARERGLACIELINSEHGYTFADTSPPLTNHDPPTYVNPEDVAVVLMTSGSTGLPKWVPLTHKNLCIGAKSVADSLNLTCSDLGLVMWEQYHVGGLVDLLLAPMVSGGKVICGGSFHAEKFFELLARYRPSWFQGVPTTLRELVVHGSINGDFPLHNGSLRFVRSVAAPLPDDLMRRLEDLFDVPVIQTLGMTEASPLITTNLLPPQRRKTGSTGLPFGCDVAVMGNSGSPLPVEKVGEVAVRGDNVFAGYENNSEANAKAFRDGWFYTGDQGYFDQDGFLFLTGRIKELINRGGEKISPAEVEDVVLNFPKVLQAAAFSIPHPSLGEDVGIAVVTEQQSQIKESEIRDFVREQLSAFKTPAIVLFLDELPRCPIGKVRRRELAELAFEKTKNTRSYELNPTEKKNAPHRRLQLIEQRLASIWSLHLDVEQVAIDDEFQLLGGDSLAWLRMILAVQKVFGVELDDDSTLSGATVRNLSKRIDQRGVCITNACVGNKDLALKLDRDLLSAGDADPRLSQAKSTVTRSHLLKSQSIHDLRIAFESFRNDFTASELLASLRMPMEDKNKIPAAKKGWLGWFQGRTDRPDIISFPMISPKIQRQLSKWEQQIELDTQHDRSDRWSRQPLATHVSLYQQNNLGPRGRTLLVGFAGNQMRLMLPTYLFLAHLGQSYDLLMLSDSRRKHFTEGIADVAPSFEELVVWLQAETERLGYDRLQTIGTSAGGLASICFGIRLGCSYMTAVGADSLQSHPTFTTYLQRGAGTPQQTPTILLACDEKNRRDFHAAQEIQNRIKGCHLCHLAAKGSHNVFRPALKSGRLTELLRMLLGETRSETYPGATIRQIDQQTVFPEGRTDPRVA